MSRVALVVLTAVIGGCRVGGPLQGAACVVAPAAVRPVLLGDSVQLAVARIDRTQCRAPDSTHYHWSRAHGSEPAVAQVRPTGWVVARQVGPFRVEGRGDTLLVVDGFVLPAGWRPRLRLPARHMTVGDTLRVVVDALDARGRVLPWIPFDVTTSDDIQFLRSGDAPRPLGLRSLGPAVAGGAEAFVADAAGSVLLRGYIGALRDSATVEVRARLGERAAASR